MSSEANSGNERSGFHLRALFLLALFLFGTAGLPGAAQKVVSRTLSFDGHQRAYQLLIPAQTSTEPVPLIVLLHGRGGNGARPMAAWHDLAQDQGIALAAPDAFAEGWTLKDDGPAFFEALIETIKKNANIDGRRVYLFGHSSGGHLALGLGPLESEYFAAVAVHAGALNPSERLFLQQARRKIPIGFWHGKADRIVPLQLARDTRDMFTALGFPVAFSEIDSHTHDYFSHSKRINDEVWSFLKRYSLPADPVYRPWVLRR